MYYCKKTLSLVARLNSQSELCIILRENRLFPKTLNERSEQHLARFSASGRQTIVAPQSLLPGYHQTGLTEIRQVPRGRGLRHTQHSNEVANTQLSTAEQIQNPQPCLVRERPKDRLDRNWCGSCFHIRLRECSHSEKTCQG